MLDEYEFYQGVVLRQLVVEISQPVAFRPFVREGRINAFVLNKNIGVYVKHASARMSPWRFTFSIEQAADLLDLEVQYPETFVALVCETDGIVVLSAGELHQVVSFHDTEKAWLRIDRPYRGQYSVSGNRAPLPRKVPRGMDAIASALLGRKELV